MSTSAERQAGEPAPQAGQFGPPLGVLDDRAIAAGITGRPGNRPATASLLAGLFGFSLITIVPGVVLGIFGLRRAARVERGLTRCWIGITTSLTWAAVAVFLVPHLLRAADPGCAIYKGPGLAAYNNVIADFNAAGPRTSLASDLTAADSRFRAAAASSGNPPAARALSGLATDLHTVLSGIRHRTGVPSRELAALNKAAKRVDRACGTLGT